MNSYKLRHWLFFAAILIGAASPIAGLIAWRWSVWGIMASASVFLLSVAVMLAPDEHK